MIPRKVIRSYDNKNIIMSFTMEYTLYLKRECTVVIQSCNIRTELCRWSIIVHFVCFPFSAPEARAE